MATRSEEQRVARWCKKHREELLRVGVDFDALLSVIIAHDPDAIPFPTKKGRKPGCISRKIEDRVGAINGISPEQFIKSICWLIKLINDPKKILIRLDNCNYRKNYFENTPKGFAKLMLAFKDIIPGVEKKTIFNIVSESLAGYNVGAYSTFGYHSGELSKDDYKLLTIYLNEMRLDL